MPELFLSFDDAKTFPWMALTVGRAIVDVARPCRTMERWILRVFSEEPISEPN